MNEININNIIFNYCNSGLVHRLGYTVLIRASGVRLPGPEIF